MTSSPSVLSAPLPALPTAEKKEKRRSYLEAVSNSSINLLEAAPPRQSKSADPLWLPASRPVQL